METISNIASAATGTVSTLIYGEQAKKNETPNNETSGKEPVSGQLGKGTVAEPYDQGNLPTPLTTGDEKALGEGISKDTSSKDGEFLKLNPTIDGPKNEEGAPKVHSNAADTTYTGMPIVPLNPDVASSGPTTKSSETAGTTATTGITDKVWKETPLDDISRSGAPGAGPEAPTTVTASTETHEGSGIPTKEPTTEESKVIKETTKEAEKVANGEVSPKASTGVATDGGNFDASKPGAAKDAKSLGEESKSTDPLSKTSSEEKSGKMSHLKEKLKDKLHIGHKDK